MLFVIFKKISHNTLQACGTLLDSIANILNSCNGIEKEKLNESDNNVHRVTRKPMCTS